MAHVIRMYNIPSPALIVNGDQTQVILSPGSGMTYAETGSNQVSMVGAEDKHAFTTFVNIAANGTLLPFQAIYQGHTVCSVPLLTARQMDNAINHGFLFEMSKTNTYWSTQGTMKSYVKNVLTPYFADTRRKLGLPPDQVVIWIIDCWLVHQSAEFQDWMHIHYPHIIILYVPAAPTDKKDASVTKQKAGSSALVVHPSKFPKKENATLAQQIEVLDWYHMNGGHQKDTAQHFNKIYPNLKIKQPLISWWLKDEEKWHEQWEQAHHASEQTAKRA
ncbi:hypothetical protein BDQ17DRAFT_1432923 [Cyathus striatus]|nr:hypothetical protein BDQ17DRAFT_1432923 [Cyathus striatus]